MPFGETERQTIIAGFLKESVGKSKERREEYHVIENMFFGKDWRMQVDFVRIIPAQRFTGTPATPHRPYAFYADAFSLHGRTIAECYRLVKGLNLPPKGGYYQKECRTPFAWGEYTIQDPDAPLAEIYVSSAGELAYKVYPFERLENNEYVVLGISLAQAEAE